MPAYASSGRVFLRSGSWAKTMAPNISTQPITSLADIFCPRNSHPAKTEITDSKLKIKLATVGLRPFCPMIWTGVNPPPRSKTPAYKMGAQEIATASGIRNSLYPQHAEARESAATKN